MRTLAKKLPLMLACFLMGIMIPMGFSAIQKVRINKVVAYLEQHGCEAVPQEMIDKSKDDLPVSRAYACGFTIFVII